MSDSKTADGGNIASERRLSHYDAHVPEHAASFAEGKQLEGRKLEVCADVNHIADLGMENTDEIQKQIVRKLDTWMLPQLWILYMFNYLNRTNIAQARLNTFDEDLKLVDGDYQTAVAILTVGYMLAQLPSNMLMTRVRPSIYLSAAALVWSAVSAATVGCKSAGSLWAVQFVLGIVEAPLFPGAVFLMACWYTRREFGLRVALLYSGLVLAQAFSGLIAAGVFAGMDGAMGLAGWKWLFILEAVGSGVFAITAFFVLPNFPTSTNGGAMWYMTEDMRRVAAARILDDRVENSEKSSVWVGLKLALTDIKLYGFVFLNLSITSSYGFNNYFPTMIRGLGFGSRVTSLLMTAPPYVWGTLCTFYVSWDSDRRGERGLHIIIPLSCSIVGFIVTVATGNNAVRYAMTFLYAAGCFSANTMQYTWAVSTLGQTPEKRAAGGAIVNLCGHIGNVISPYFFPDRHAPRYTMAMLLQIGFASVAVGLASIIKWHLVRKNKKLRAEAESVGVPYNPFTT